MKENKTVVRPSVKDFFPTIEEAHESYLAVPNLFKYVQALDNYIDELDATPVSEYAYIEMPVEKEPDETGWYSIETFGGRKLFAWFENTIWVDEKMFQIFDVKCWLKKVPISSLVEQSLREFLEYIGKQGLYVETDGTVWKDAFEGGSQVDAVADFLKSSLVAKRDTISPQAQPEAKAIEQFKTFHYDEYMERIEELMEEYGRIRRSGAI